MKSSFKIQYHPNQEDKTGNPTYASGTRLNYSANESRLEEDVARTIDNENFFRRIIRYLRGNNK